MQAGAVTAWLITVPVKVVGIFIDSSELFVGVAAFGLAAGLTVHLG